MLKTVGIIPTTGSGNNVLADRPTFTSTIGVGGAAASTSGSGITFPATQSPSTNANTLDDYEEGTWTPTLEASSSGTITLSFSACSYVKIGRLVTVSGTLLVGSVASPLGELRLSGLPFTTNASFRGAGIVQLGAFLVTNAFTSASIQVGTSSSFANIRGLNNGAQVQTMAANVQSNSSINFNLTYEV